MTIETRQFNLIFRGGFGIEHHQFWVHSLMLYRLYYKLIDEAVTFRRKRFSARSSRVGGGHGVRVWRRENSAKLLLLTWSRNRNRCSSLL